MAHWYPPTSKEQSRLRYPLNLWYSQFPIPWIRYLRTSLHKHTCIKTIGPAKENIIVPIEVQVVDFGGGMCTSGPINYLKSRTSKDISELAGLELSLVAFALPCLYMSNKYSGTIRGTDNTPLCIILLSKSGWSRFCVYMHLGHPLRNIHNHRVVHRRIMLGRD